MTFWKAEQKSKAYHEAGHAIAARHLGFPVEYTTIDDETDHGHVTKTVHLSDYFDEDHFYRGRLKRKGKGTINRSDLRLFYALLLQSLAGYTAVELAGLDMRVVRKDHGSELQLVQVRSRCYSFIRKE